MRNRNVLTIVLAIAMVLAISGTARADLTGVTWGTDSGATFGENPDESFFIHDAGGGDWWGGSHTGYLVYESTPVVGNGEIIAQIMFDNSAGRLGTG